jgi:hypothetical protein
VEIDFSEAMNLDTIPDSVIVTRVLNRRGEHVSERETMAWSMDDTQQTLTVQPETRWAGNTIYDVSITAAARSITGYGIENEIHIYFQTMLDPKEDNRLVQPINPAAQASARVPSGALHLEIPSSSLSDYAAVLSTRDPLTSPLRVDPNSIREANRKARQASPYRIPMALREISAFNAQGQAIAASGKPMLVTLSASPSETASAAETPYIRSNTLSVWGLDEEHKLWVKIPASRATGEGSVSAPATHFSVFALMGSASGSTSEVFVFPTPWRPNGPNAGDGQGQTGSVAGGITFTTLPSECRIKIYTLAGELVRELVHSDVNSPEQSRERWDGKTSGGDPVASGVYLWRVESDVDTKTGKLMVIR